jgi:hypothetical protein
MDEDGRHSNCLGANNDQTNSIQLNLCTGGVFGNAQIGPDLDGVLGQFANDYFSNMNTVFGNHFGNGSSRKVLNLGPDPLIYLPDPAPGVLQAAGQYTDAIGLVSYIQGFSMTQAALDYIRQYAGDKPLLNVDFIQGQGDSALRGSPASIEAVSYSTQQSRGVAYQALVGSMTSLAYTNGGDHPYVGTSFWQYADSMIEHANWGLVTPYDNAYDGHEDVTGSVACSAPNQAFTCGAEQFTSGDFITRLKQANSLWLLFP